MTDRDAEAALVARIDAVLLEERFVRERGFVPAAVLPPGTKRRGYFPRGVFSDGV